MYCTVNNVLNYVDRDGNWYVAVDVTKDPELIKFVNDMIRNNNNDLNKICNDYPYHVLVVNELTDDVEPIDYCEYNCQLLNIFHILRKQFEEGRIGEFATDEDITRIMYENINKNQGNVFDNIVNFDKSELNNSNIPDLSSAYQSNSVNSLPKNGIDLNNMTMSREEENKRYVETNFDNLADYPVNIPHVHYHPNQDANGNYIQPQNVYYQPQYTPYTSTTNNYEVSDYLQSLYQNKAWENRNVYMR